MAEALLNQLLNGEIGCSDLLQWLFGPTNAPPCRDASSQFGCSRTDFITFFLNFVHEEVPPTKPDPHSFANVSTDSPTGGANKSHSGSLDVSTEVEEDEGAVTSTPKMNKAPSEYSPISPLYRPCNFTTPKGPPHKSPICLGDFIITKRVSGKKKKGGDSDPRRRIKPTNLTQTRSSFQKCENSYTFNKSQTEEELATECDLQLEEKLRLASRNLSRMMPQAPPSEIKARLDLVTYKQQLDDVVQVYGTLLEHSYVQNLTSEVYFLLSLLLKRQYHPDWGVEVLKDHVTAPQVFRSIHNVVYFAAQSLHTLVRLLSNLDRSTLRMLTENALLREFCPQLVRRLHQVAKPDRTTTETRPTRDNVCFNSDTDNRQNFPNDPSFHAFRKQRDLFYEVLRIWEQHHLSPGFSFVLSLGGKIKTLLGLYTEPSNFVHFARLFKAQLLSSCSNSVEGCDDLLITSLEVDREKLSKLQTRCVTKDGSGGLNALPGFTEVEEFYKEFVVVAANPCFNRHLVDALMQEIVELNATASINELEDRDEVDVATRKSYHSTLKSLRMLAKFLGFVESLPYKTEHNHYSEQLLAMHLRVRRQVCPNFDVKTILQDSIRTKSVILCVPWLVKYLSMLDYITLKLPYYTTVQHHLFWLYRNFNWGPDCNIYLVKFCLGWLFELAHMPDHNYLQYCSEETATANQMNGKSTADLSLDQLEMVDQDILYFCCPYLDEIKKLLSSTLTNSNTLTIKHITPITALQSPEEMARKRIEQQLEEAFFNGQPVSLRKTVEFISERVASTCVKYVCSTVVPDHRKQALDRFRVDVEGIEEETEEARKITLKTRANQLAAVCLEELQVACDREIGAICTQKIPKAVDSLVSLDILPQTKEVCVSVTRKICVERIQQWVASHVTSGMFTKDFNDEIQKMLSSCEGKKVKRPLFMLPPGGNNSNHNDATTSAAHLLEKFRNLCISGVEQRAITENQVTRLLNDTLTSIRERGDVNQCILATLCTLLLDLSLVLLTHHAHVMAQDGVMSKACHIWRLYFNGCDDLFKSLLSPRNVTMFAQSPDPEVTWEGFARFCAFLFRNRMLSCDNFETQCTGIFRTEWSQGTLRLITKFLKRFVSLYRDEGGDCSDFALLLDFLGDYCEDL